jgi:ATP-dependent DNA helicase PIF1
VSTPSTIYTDPRAKRLTITVRRDGSVRVTKPRWVSVREAERFLARSDEWVRRARQRIAAQPKTSPIEPSAKEYKKFKTAALDLVERRIRYFNVHYGLEYSKVSVRNQKSRWGSCSHTGTLSFNYRIVFLPAHLVDYIVVHELCHLKEMNHSKRFWRSSHKQCRNIDPTAESSPSGETHFWYTDPMTQDEALAILKTGLNVFLTGEPGSGKTHTISRYIAWLKERGVDPAVTASTGIAATHVGGMTVHSWSGIGIKRKVNDYDIELIQSREKTARRILDAKVLIIDEISMLDAATLESVDRVLRTLRRRPLREEEPFGGLQVIFVGDFFQLPPVSRGEEPQFAFESRAWKEANLVICYIAEQHRQEDADFLDLLSALRHGTFGAKHRNRLAARTGISPKDEVATRLYTHNENVDRINAGSLSKLKTSSHVFQMTTRGPKALVETLKQQCLSPETLELKEGARVMFTRNNFDVGYVNGTLGEVSGFSATGQPIVKTQGGSITVESAEWVIQDGPKVLARVTQLPLRLAWAITVHKSQGMSLDAAVIDLSQAFEYGQGYVAISRVRNLSGLFLEGFNERALELHPKVAIADRHFRAHSEAAQKKFASLSANEKGNMEKNFLRAIGAKEHGEAAPRGADSSHHFSRDMSLRDDARNPSHAPASRHTELKEKYPNIGMPWSKADDEALAAMFKENVVNKDIAKHFGRKPSAVRARLAHLGLIKDFWTNRAKAH